MKKVTVFFFAVILIILSCNTTTTKNNPAVPVSDTSKFYPLRNFFKDQIQYVDLRNFPIYKITVKNGKKDSAALSKDAFIALAEIFLNKDISAPQVKVLYKEAIFHDLSTGSVTINYTPVNSKAEVQNIDILLDEETNMVKRIFIRSVYIRSDTTISEQCNWKANKSFQVNRYITAKNGYTSTELNYINWNDKP